LPISRDTAVHPASPHINTTRTSRASSGGLQLPRARRGSRPRLHRWAHCALVRPAPTKAATAGQALWPYRWMPQSRRLSSAMLHERFPGCLCSGSGSGGQDKIASRRSSERVPVSTGASSRRHSADGIAQSQRRRRTDSMSCSHWTGRDGGTSSRSHESATSGSGESPDIACGIESNPCIKILALI
jgi:hypothetical protein